MNIRITSKIFYDVIIMMAGFGMLVGVIFPFFLILVGIPNKFVLNTKFFAYCIVAGFLVAIVNMVIVNKIIIWRIHILSEQMREIEDIINTLDTTEGRNYNSEMYRLKEDSDDTLGECIKSYNRLIDALSRALKFESDIRAFTHLLSTCFEINALSDKALDQLVESFSAEGGLLLNYENDQLVISASAGNMIDVDINFGRVLEIMLEGKILLINNQQEECRCINSELLKNQNIVIQPIINEEVPLAVLILSKGTPFTGQDIKNLEIQGISLSIALKNVIIHNQLREYAARDTLTGLYNRRFGMIRLDEEFSRSARGGQSVGLIMFDIDYFKKINDSFGHLTGDKVLVHVSALARECLRAGDILMRYGGEEFLCILPGGNCGDCFKVAERIRKTIMEQIFQFNGKSIHITISAGIAAYPEITCDSTEELINAVDIALYNAKKSGRNKVII